MWLLPEDDVAGPVSLPGLDQGKVSGDGLLHDVVPAIELAHLEATTNENGFGNLLNHEGRIINFQQIN